MITRGPSKQWRGTVLAQRTGRSRKDRKPSCEDCYFRRNMLCALDVEEPCATFRPDRPEGLVPPRQPVLLMRAPRWAAEPQTPVAFSREPASVRL
jgi:hypothetical protein